ncbi:hypothetical protein TEK04_01125 [Klenkia sp. LSe6-5]|uniref:Uncharacterized protein n=1 Tax=Klenkia sesuvii TaxID=3103137 RepID=A0ABU8DNC8_9ACTN
MSPGGRVLPVGFRLGPETMPQPVVGTVRLGWRRLGLGLDETLVWDLAHGVPGDDPLADAERLLAHAAAAGVADPSAVVEGLLARSLLVRVPPAGQDPAALEALAHRLRARPLLVGIGSGSAPGTTALGVPGWPVLELPDVAAHRWDDTAVLPDLWAAAEFSLVREDGPDAPPPTHDRLLAATAVVVDDLPVLLAHHCAYLDLATP